MVNLSSEGLGWGVGVFSFSVTETVIEEATFSFALFLSVPSCVAPLQASTS